MKARLGYIGTLVAVCMMFASTAGATSILVSSQGILNDPQQVFEQSFTYNPATDGGTLMIQTYGYGGSANGSLLGATGRNLAGNIISPGGFDPYVGLYAGPAGGGGARVAINDDGTCAPHFGTVDAGTGACFDSTIVINGLAAGIYTVALSVFANVPPGTETTPYPGGGNFTDVTGAVRTNAFAIDVAAVPEPASLTLFGTGVAALLARRRKSKKDNA